MGQPPLLLPDTNLVVGAFMDDPLLAPLWAWCLAAPGRHACSPLLLAECHHVLRRPELRRARGWPDAAIDDRLAALFQPAVVLQDPAEEHAAAAAASALAPDPGDQFLWNLLLATPGLVLVTRDKQLLKDKGMKRRGGVPANMPMSRAPMPRVWSPQQAWACIAATEPPEPLTPPAAAAPAAP